MKIINNRNLVFYVIKEIATIQTCYDKDNFYNVGMNMEVEKRKFLNGEKVPLGFILSEYKIPGEYNKEPIPKEIFDKSQKELLEIYNYLVNQVE